jgi:competence protein CoiA
MLTCKVGDNLINTIDYSDEQIRKWSNKCILKCPVCDSNIIYRHGEIKIAHFAHSKDSNCKDIYSEPETEEHMMGKKILYEWLKQQQGIENLKLEAWIPETKQRPDIYFELNGVRYVIEFQCTPIATEYIQRHRLYELAGIKDIWILGTFKYNIMVTNTYVAHNLRLKEIEKYKHAYLDVNNKKIVLNKNIISSYLPYKELKLDNYYMYELEDVYLDYSKKQISPLSNIIDNFTKKDVYEYSLVKEQRIAERDRRIQEKTIREKEWKQKSYIVDKCRKLINTFNERFKIVNENCVFDLHDNNSEYYLCKIVFSSEYLDYTFFVKSNKTDCCVEEPCTKMELLGGRGKRGGLRKRYYPSYKYINRASISYEEFNIEKLEKFICDIISTSLRIQKYGIYAKEEGLNV